MYLVCASEHFGLLPPVTKPDVLEGTSTNAPTTSKVAGVLPRFTPPSQECIQNQKAPNVGSQNAVDRIMRVRLLTTESIRPVNPSSLSATTAPTTEPNIAITGGRLSIPFERHVHTAAIIRTRHMTNRTIVPISTVFDRFRDMKMPGIQSNSA
ncbi:hypothetical protein Tco_1415613 [Tanacetum coccineum]